MAALMREIDELDVLLVEDNEDDVEQVRRLFARSAIEARLTVARDFCEARLLLARLGRSGRKRRSVVMLDLRLSPDDGRDILRWIKREPRLRSLPVVMLTSSPDTDHIEECFELGSEMYLIKPIDAADIANVVWGMQNFWGEAAEDARSPRQRAA
jgi:CheY-like chemotaxis protein